MAHLPTRFCCNIASDVSQKCNKFKGVIAVSAAFSVHFILQVQASGGSSMLTRLSLAIFLVLTLSANAYAAATPTPAPADVLSPQSLMDIGNPPAIPAPSPPVSPPAAAPASPAAAAPAVVPATVPAATPSSPAVTPPATATDVSPPAAPSVGALISPPTPTVTLPLPKANDSSTHGATAQPEKKDDAAPATPTPTTPSTTNANSLRVIADRWCPYNCDVTAKQPGYMVEITKEIFSQANMEVKYKILPWSLGIAEVTRGETDAILGMDKLEGKGLIFPQESLGNYTLKIYAKTGSKFNYTGPNAFDGMVLGIVQDYSYGKAINSYISSTGGNKRLFVVSGEEPVATLVNSLVAGKIDLFIEDGSVTAYYLKLHNLASTVSEVGQISLTDTAGAPVIPSLYLAFAPSHAQSQHLSTLFDEGIKKLRASGRLKEILSSYGLTDWAL
jgi:polar amino acid transport system substrate-binding protein